MSFAGSAEVVRGELVTGNYYEVLGVGAVVGRTMTADDDRIPGGHPVAVLSYGFWDRRFGRNPKVINSTILLGGQPFTIIGVTEKTFEGTERGFPHDIQVPMMMQNQVTPGRDLLHS